MNNGYTLANVDLFGMNMSYLCMGFIEEWESHRVNESHFGIWLWGTYWNMLASIFTMNRFAKVLPVVNFNKLFESFYLLNTFSSSMILSSMRFCVGRRWLDSYCMHSTKTLDYNYMVSLDHPHWLDAAHANDELWDCLLRRVLGVFERAIYELVEEMGRNGINEKFVSLSD